MKRFVETVAALALLASLVAAVAVPLRLEASRRQARDGEPRTIELTGLMDQGVWTDEVVSAAAAWRRDFRPAQPVLRAGETVRLRLASADVVHAFAAPELGVERVEVYPGEIVEILVTPREAGIFEYYCTTVCGDAHFGMRGFVEVVADDGGPPRSVVPSRPGDGYWLAPEPPASADRNAHGAWLYRRQGCVTCHGEAGAGGVPNPGSMNALVPALANLRERMFLFEEADVEAFLAVLDGAAPLEAVQDAVAVPLFAAVKDRYLATRRLVREGRTSVRLDPAAPRPPLDMPAWEARLPESDVDAILVYLLTPGDGTAYAPSSTAVTSSTKGDPR